MRLSNNLVRLLVAALPSLFGCPEDGTATAPPGNILPDGAVSTDGSPLGDGGTALHSAGIATIFLSQLGAGPARINGAAEFYNAKDAAAQAAVNTYVAQRADEVKNTSLAEGKCGKTPERKPEPPGLPVPTNLGPGGVSLVPGGDAGSPVVGKTNGSDSIYQFELTPWVGGDVTLSMPPMSATGFWTRNAGPKVQDIDLTEGSETRLEIALEFDLGFVQVRAGPTPSTGITCRPVRSGSEYVLTNSMVGEIINTAGPSGPLEVTVVTEKTIPVKFDSGGPTLGYTALLSERFSLAYH